MSGDAGDVAGPSSPPGPLDGLQSPLGPLSDGAGPSGPHCPIIPTHPIPYHDYATGDDFVCDPSLGPPCLCYGSVAYYYSNWVVHQLETERAELVMTLMEEREGRRANARYQWERINELERGMGAAERENDRLRQRIEHLEERMAGVRAACEVTMVISSEHTGARGSEQSVAGPAEHAGVESDPSEEPSGDHSEP